MSTKKYYVQGITSIDSIVEEYYLSTSNTTQTGGAWTTTPPTWVQGKYIWSRLKYTYKNPARVEYSQPTLDHSTDAVSSVAQDLAQNYYDKTVVDFKIDDGIISTVEGRNPQTTDSADGKLMPMVAIVGQSKQETTEGVNKFDADGFYGEYKQADGSYEAKISVFNSKRRYFTEDEIGKPFTFSALIKTDSDSLQPTIGFNINRVYYYADFITDVTKHIAVKITDTPISTNDFVTFLYVDGVENINVKNIMLNEGTEPLPYEPHTGGQPSPSVNYPQPVTGVAESGEIEVVADNGNAIPTDLYRSIRATATLNNNELTIKSDGTYSFASVKVFLVGGKTYYFDGALQKESDSDVTRIQLFNMNGNEINNNVSQQLSVQNTGYYELRFYSNYTGVSETNTVVYKNIHLKNNNSLSYIQSKPIHKMTVTNIEPLHGIPVQSGGNVEIDGVPHWADVLTVYSDGSGRIERNISKKVFDGSENWNIQSINANGYVNFLLSEACIRVNKNANTLSLSNLFLYDNNVIANVTKNGFRISVVTGDLYFRAHESVCSTVSEWKEFLSNNNVEMYFIITEPTIEPLTKDQVTSFLNTYEGVTNISNSENAYTIVDYYRDTPIRKDVETLVTEHTNEIHRSIDFIRTASGKHITLKDAANAQVQELKMFGKSSQETTSGNQLLNYDAWKTISVEGGNAVFENNGVTLTASKTDCYTGYGVNFSEAMMIPISVGQTVTISWDADENVEGQVFIFPDGINSNNVVCDTRYSRNMQYTAIDGDTKIKFRFGVYNTGDTIHYKNIMINYGSGPLPYEPYTGGIPSPNPSYPQTIESVGDKCTNHFDAETLYGQYKQGDGSYRTTAINIHNIERHFTVDELGKTFCFSAMVRVESSEMTALVSGYINGAYIYGNTVGTIGEYALTKVVVTPTTVNDVVRISYSTGGNNYISVKNVMLNEGTEPLSYELYRSGYQIDIISEDADLEPTKSSLSTLYLPEPLRGIPVQSGGNYTDESGQQYISDVLRVFSDGTGEIERNVVGLIIDDSLSITQWSDSFLCVQDAQTRCPLAINDVVLCDNFVYKPHNTRGASEYVFANVGFGQIILYNPNNNKYTIESLQSLIAEKCDSGNPITALYATSEPTIEPLTADQVSAVLETYNPVTHISNGEEADMDVAYAANTKVYQVINDFVKPVDLQKQIDEIKKELEDDQRIIDIITNHGYVFGYDKDNSDENPDTRITYPTDVLNYNYTPAGLDSNNVFHYGDWPSNPGELFMPRPCMLRYDGTVGEYLDPNDYTKTIDGSPSNVANPDYEGNAMMEWPKLYTYRAEINGITKFRVSNVKIGKAWECWSNYDKDNNQTDVFYTPIYFGSNVNDKLRSISGQTNSVSTNTTTEVTLATANGEGWYTEVVADWLLIQDLLVMMCKSTNTQAKYGYGVCSASAAIATGTMNDKGLFYGTTANYTTGVKVFGMENWWGNIWRRVAGWINDGTNQKIKLTRGTKDGSTATDYNQNGTGYLTIPGASPTGTSGGYIKSMVTMPYGNIPYEVAGSSTTYECDGLWFGVGYTSYALVGAGWGTGLLCGAFDARLHNGAGTANSNIGASLSYK